MTPERAGEIAQVLADSLATGEASSIGVSWAEAIAEGIKLACAEQRQEYADLMDEAAVNVSDWGAYASEYFQDKWDLAGYVKKWQDRAAEIRDGEMNKHIIIEEHPHSLRHLVMSYVFCGGLFFLIGVGGRPVIDYTWNRWMDIPAVTIACVPEPKPTMHWGKQK